MGIQDDIFSNFLVKSFFNVLSKDQIFSKIGDRYQASILSENKAYQVLNVLLIQCSRTEIESHLVPLNYFNTALKIAITGT